MGPREWRDPRKPSPRLRPPPTDPPQRSISSQGSTVWCIAANPASTLLALGCEDSSVRLLALADDALARHCRLDHLQARLLSITWGPPCRSAAMATLPWTTTGTRCSGPTRGSLRAPGCSLSSVHKFDVASGRVLERMTTHKARGERMLVWAAGMLGCVSSRAHGGRSDCLGQGRHDRVRRLTWDGHILGHTHVHAAAELPCAWRRCAVPCNWARMYSTAVHTHPPLMFPQEGRSVYTSGVD